MRKGLSVGILAGALGVLAALAFALQPAPPAVAADGGGPGAANAARTVDELLASIDAASGGFGGLFIDEAGDLNVYLADAAEEGVAIEAADEVLKLKGLEALPIRVRRAEHRFLDLARWRGQVKDLLAAPGVSLTDVDEAANRVRIGIEDESARPRVEAEVARLGVPPEAVIIEVTGPFVYRASLQGRVRPVVGGLQIAFGCSASSCYVCTDGFLAIRAGKKGFVTNSHCTDARGIVEQTAYSQPFPTTTAARRVGKETADPAFFTGGACPAGRRCRYADAAFVQKKREVDFKRGFIARPAYVGSLSISVTSPRFRVVSEDPGPLVGEVLEKVGRTTGWTQGTVTDTCVDISVSGTDITLLCQDAVAGSSDQGDSGSPVFRIESGNDVSLYGILWGGAPGMYVFSRLTAIERSDELGPLVTCDPKVGC